MGFIPKNEGFPCEACGFITPKAAGTFRNHCPQCLTSKHVDDTIPGDRQSSCQGLMPATGVEGTDPDNLDLLHQCTKCGKTMRNRTALDDNKEAIYVLMAEKSPF